MRVTINEKKSSLKHKLDKFNKPEKIYLPVENMTVLVKKDDYVYKEMLVAKDKTTKMPIYSSISGNVLDYEIKTNSKGEKEKCLVIENDYKELIKQREKPKEIVEIIKDAGIIGMSGSGFPTYKKYNQQINTLIINATECEPIISSDEQIIKDKHEEILETIDEIAETKQIKNIVIAIKKNDQTIKHLLNKYIGSYPKIKLREVPNYYPIGWSRELVYYLYGVNKDISSHKEGIVVQNISTIYAIHEALKYNKPLIERVITFDGNALKNPHNIVVKTGTLLKDIIKDLKLAKCKYQIIAGGPMMGVEVDENLIITPDITGILFIKKEKTRINQCIRCGKCIEICPQKLSPVLIKDNMDEKQELKKLHSTKCIECGLCSYICPSKLPVRNLVKMANEIFKEKIK